MIDWRHLGRQHCSSCDDGKKNLSVGPLPDGRLRARCFKCEAFFWPDEAPLAKPVQRAETSKKHETLSYFGHELWDACRCLAEDAHAYLMARACVIPPADGDLRWHPALKHPPSGYVGPALVALVTDAVTREPLTLHRTWIRADGAKVSIEPPRMLLGGHRKAGGVIRLWPDECVTYGLGIGEGIESALSLAHAVAPAWACIDAGNLGALPVLPAIEVLTIGADNDTAGLAAANTCARRWTAAGRDVRIVVPDVAGADLNDLARAP